MLKGIENIILDLGGVIINLNHELTWQAFQRHFPENYSDLLVKLKEEMLLERFETGHVSSDEFFDFFCTSVKTIDKQNIIAAWNCMLLDIPKARIMLIKELSKKYNLFLLSNTNEIHYNFIEDYYRSQYEDVSFSSLFSKAYLSYQIGHRKPNREIFEEVIKDAKINPSTTLFMDDSLEHIQTAKAIGIKAIHLDLNKQQSLTTLFNEY